MKNQHHPLCPRQSECTLCYPTNLERLAQLCSLIEITTLYSGGYMIDCDTAYQENEGHVHASAETIELAALKLLKQLEDVQ